MLHLYKKSTLGDRVSIFLKLSNLGYSYNKDYTNMQDTAKVGVRQL